MSASTHEFEASRLSSTGCRVCGKTKGRHAPEPEFASAVDRSIAFALEIVERDVAKAGAQHARAITERAFGWVLAKHTVPELATWAIENIGRPVTTRRPKRAEVLAEIVENFEEAFVPAP